MKFNLKNRPRLEEFSTDLEYEETTIIWFEGFEKELRNRMKDAELMKAPKGIIPTTENGIWVIIKEILGE